MYNWQYISKNLSFDKPDEIKHYLVKFKNLAFNKALEIWLNLFGPLGEYFRAFVSIF